MVSPSVPRTCLLSAFFPSLHVMPSAAVIPSALSPTHLPDNGSTFLVLRARGQHPDLASILGKAQYSTIHVEKASYYRQDAQHLPDGVAEHVDAWGGPNVIPRRLRSVMAMQWVTVRRLAVSASLDNPKRFGTRFTIPSS